jgi:hypothetical protein
MDERVRFIARFLEGEKVARLAVEFGISRKTELGGAEDRRASGPALSRTCGVGPAWAGEEEDKIGHAGQEAHLLE